jgi:hypothetical protein
MLRQAGICSNTLVLGSQGCTPNPSPRLFQQVAGLKGPEERLKSRMFVKQRT